MVKNELLKAISTKIEGISQKDIGAVLAAYEEVVIETLTSNENEKISLGKLGSFKVKSVPERVGTIMMGERKGEQYCVPEHSEITFKMSKTAKQIQIGSDFLNKQEENISDVITLENTEEIVGIMVEHAFHTDKTVGLIANRYLVEYALDELIKIDYTSIKRVVFDDKYEDNEIEYMISVDDDGYIVVQPVEYYKDKYFVGMDIIYISMDGDVDQTTIDMCLCNDKEVILFGYDEDCECDCYNCIGNGVCEKTKDNAATTSATSTASYSVNGKSVSKEEYENKMAEFDKVYRKHLLDMCEMMDEMNEWRKLFRW